MKFVLIILPGERYDFVINADQPVGAYWIQVRGLGECGIRRVQQLAIIRYARGPYQPTTVAPTYDVGIPQGVVSKLLTFIAPFVIHLLILFLFLRLSSHSITGNCTENTNFRFFKMHSATCTYINTLRISFNYCKYLFIVTM